MTTDPKPKAKRLGRGLSALIGEVEGAGNYDSAPEQTTAPARDSLTLPMADIRPNPQQPRRFFAESDLAELAESIRAKGVLQAILSVPTRRMLASIRLSQASDAGGPRSKRG